MRKKKKEQEYLIDDIYKYYNDFLETIGKEKTKNYKLLIRKLDECPEYYGNVINVLQIDEILKNREYVKMMNMIEESDYYDRETIIKYLLYKEKMEA